ncbi:hypothetical protein GbCGDNIH3_7188 [Granulibacter bethesdensis]|uniref:Uncharacterized protein n=1 Tax=Granulibacter bethesdensis TaxID=364410 RepID=A0AAN0RC38_9PROT|nr:hypothetical protein GbCGDNIH3_7188 [Granulibacter bethesdensis]AHJ64706.1 hypothetical protein GbCGDNIH4_7082 [Granulibacter bethesdensis CGDNIH4]APH58622.1 hypothetical protein GbCGDNIH7_7188 [Granulibacter bethesdensis]
MIRIANTSHNNDPFPACNATIAEIVSTAELQNVLSSQQPYII